MIPNRIEKSMLPQVRRAVASCLTIALMTAALMSQGGGVALAESPATAAVANPSGGTVDGTPANQISDALASAGSLDKSDAVPTTSDADSALSSKVNGVTVDVARDPSSGIHLSVGTTSISITPPLSSTPADDIAQVVADGVTASPGKPGTVNTAAPTEDGRLGLSTVITQASASEDFPYKFDLPEGTHLVLTEGGGAAALGEDGLPIASIAPPWAKTAGTTAGGANSIETHFSLASDGLSLTQHVSHHGLPADAYPVVSDPLVAVFAAAVMTAAINCAAGVAGQIAWNGLKSAVLNGKRNDLLDGAMAACGTNIVFGPLGRFIPSPFKRAVDSYVRSEVRNFVLWYLRIRY